jgi:hypothetical protein
VSRSEQISRVSSEMVLTANGRALPVPVETQPQETNIPSAYPSPTSWRQLARQIAVPAGIDAFIALVVVVSGSYCGTGFSHCFYVIVFTNYILQIRRVPCPPLLPELRDFQPRIFGLAPRVLPRVNPSHSPR